MYLIHNAPLRFIIAILFLVLVPPSVVPSESQPLLEAVKCNVEFPTDNDYLSAIYDGSGNIYVFGVKDENESPNLIYRYETSSDSLSMVGTLPEATVGNPLVWDDHGNLYHFGGFDRAGQMRDTIVRFNTTSGDTEIVGRIPTPTIPRGAIRTNIDTVLLFDVNALVSVDLTTFDASEIGELPAGQRGLAWDGTDKVLLFGSKSLHNVYSISMETSSAFNTPEPYRFFSHHSVISTPDCAFIVGSNGHDLGLGNGLLEVDFGTLGFRFWPVQNYPAISPNHSYFIVATAYVPELHRLYMIGGKVKPKDAPAVGHEIWYINLPVFEEPPAPNPEPTPPPPPPPPPGPPPTTTDCYGKHDGFYPSPFSCDGYYRCLDGETFEFQCTLPASQFNPELDICDLPEIVQCDLDCSGRIDGLYPHSQDCHFYLRCWNGAAHILKCPSNHRFDRFELTCDFPHLVPCTLEHHQ